VEFYCQPHLPLTATVCSVSIGQVLVFYLRDFTSFEPCQTIDRVGQLFGHGLVSKDNRLIKSFNHDTCQLSCHDCDIKKMADDKDADAFMLLYFLTAK